jgi:hypothetical protein
MPILVANDPPELRQIAVGAFIRCNRGSSPADVVGAIKLYLATPADVFERRFTARLPIWGWRYVRTAPAGEAAFCDISLSEPHRVLHAHATTAGHLLDYAAAAEESLARNRRVFEGRILSIPAIQMEALWVHTPEPRVPDRFYGLPSSQPAWPDRGFLKEAHRRAVSALQLSTTVGEVVPENWTGC